MVSLLTSICVVNLIHLLHAKQHKLKIKGPKRYEDSIAIVGAGPSGIHMAYLLQQKGFKNIEILEKEARVGGKTFTVTNRGVAQDMGACFIEPHYNHVVELIRKFIPDDLVHFPSSSIWLDEFKKPVTFGQYVALISMGLYRASNLTVLKQKVYKAIKKYNKLHLLIFGDYEFELMPKPNEGKMFLARGTFWDYLVRHQLIALTPLFEASITLKGYGQLDEISAIYGLMWNTPRVMEAYIARMEFGENMDVGTYILKNGFQKLWEVIMREHKLSVTFNVTITKIKRDYDVGNPDIWIQRKINNGPPHWKRYDFLVWSPELAKSLPLFDNKWKIEDDLLSKTYVTYLSSSLFEARKQTRGLSPINYWIRHSNTTNENRVLAQRDTFGILHHHYGTKYRNYSYPTENAGKHTMMTSIAYQNTLTKPLEKKLHSQLRHHFEKIGAKHIDIKRTVIWRFFPRYTIKDMEDGILWRILDLQGRYATWYIGSSVSFESIKSVIDYNKLLIKNTRFPQRKSRILVEQAIKKILLRKHVALLKRK